MPTDPTAYHLGFIEGLAYGLAQLAGPRAFIDIDVPTDDRFQPGLAHLAVSTLNEDSEIFHLDITDEDNGFYRVRLATTEAVNGLPDDWASLPR